VRFLKGLPMPILFIRAKRKKHQLYKGFVRLEKGGSGAMPSAADREIGLFKRRQKTGKYTYSLAVLQIRCDSFGISKYSVEVIYTSKARKI